MDGMCGIVGYVGPRQSQAVLISGLSRLEYRGYDSAGIAVIDGDGSLGMRKRAGERAGGEIVAEDLELSGALAHAQVSVRVDDGDACGVVSAVLEASESS